VTKKEGREEEERGKGNTCKNVMREGEEREVVVCAGRVGLYLQAKKDLG